jgi:hypothetical protein
MQEAGKRGKILSKNMSEKPTNTPIIYSVY